MTPFVPSATHGLNDLTGRQGGVRRQRGQWTQMSSQSCLTSPLAVCSRAKQKASVVAPKRLRRLRGCPPLSHPALWLEIGFVKEMLSIGRYARIMHTDITTPGRWSRCFWKPSGRYPGGFAFPGYPIIFTILRQSPFLIKGKARMKIKLLSIVLKLPFHIFFCNVSDSKNEVLSV